MLLKSFLFAVFAGVSLTNLSCAHASESLRRGGDLSPVTLEQALAMVGPGDVVVIGEEHGNAVCRSQQMRILQTLRSRGLRVSVGMEFLDYPSQGWTDQYRAGLLSEAEFLANVQWGKGFPFDLYRDQILFPREAEGASTLALNAPRSLTSQVARGGLDSLSPEQKALLPPGLTRGNDRYFERFKNAIGHLPHPDAAERYFWAQSIWDETMAWRSLEFMGAHGDQVLVIVVGEFHVQYGGGLPDRLRARGAGGRVWSVSQINLTGLSEAEKSAALNPHPVDGARADFLWSFEAPGTAKAD